jgi:hypothetical protein
MKRIWLALFIAALAVGVYAQESGALSVGIGADGNMNTREHAALGGSLAVEYGITNAWAAGIKFTVSHNLSDTLVLDPEAFARLYVFQLARLAETANPVFGGVYAQAGAGVSVVRQDRYDTAPIFLGEIAAGWRFMCGNWYVEPSARFGMPFLWGAGVSGGYRFDLKKE